MARRTRAISIILDAVALLAALVVGSLAVFGKILPWQFRDDVWMMLGSLAAGAVIGVFVATRSGGNSVPRPSYGRAFTMVSIATAVATFGLALVRPYWSRSFVFTTVLVWLGLALVHRGIRRRRPWTEPLVLVTSEKVLIDHLMEAPHAEIVEVLDPAGTVPERPLAPGTALAVDLRAVLSDDMARFVSSSNLAGYPMRSLVAAYEEHTGRLPIVHLHEGWELTVPLESRGQYVNIKRGVDALTVLIVAPIALALGAIIAVAIKLDSRGPIIFRQQRVGREGRPFTLHKFRTMRWDGDTPPRFARKGDDRLTRVGKLLRRLRVDELPQLWNVMKGDLSLVGPRPEQAPFVDRFTETIPFYSHRHLVRPGLTGWAQVNFGYADSEAETIDKLSYDLYYIKHVSAWLDAEVLGRSIWTVLSGFGAR